MDKKFIAPAGIMIVTLILWIGFAVTHLQYSKTVGTLICLSAGILMPVSAIPCRQAGGPRIGNIIRTILLLLMGISSYHWINLTGGLLLMAAALLTGILVFIKPASESSHDSR